MLTVTNTGTILSQICKFQFAEISVFPVEFICSSNYKSFVIFDSIVGVGILNICSAFCKIN